MLELSREPSPNRKRALNIWLKSKRQKKPKEIADELGISAALVRKWKSIDKWDDIPEKRPRGAPKGNKNAKGNKGGPGAPEGNARALKHGLFRKFLPDDEEFNEIMDMVAEMDPLDMLWQNIITQFAAIIRAQKIMFVTGKDEMIKELKKRKFEIHDVGKGEVELVEKVTEEEYEFQFSWDRYATYLKAQSAAMSELRSNIKQFMNAAPEEDERRAKLALMQAQVKKVEAEAKAASKGQDKTPLHITIDYGDDDGGDDE